MPKIIKNEKERIKVTTIGLTDEQREKAARISKTGNVSAGIRIAIDEHGERNDHTRPSK